MPYDRYPAIDQTNNFPPVVRQALAESAEVHQEISESTVVKEAFIASSEFKTAYVETGELILNVKDFGAKGDGVTNDSVAVVAALIAAAGKALYFPVGTYLVTSATRLQMYTSYSSLIGDPSGISTLRFTNVAGGIDIGDGINFIYQNVLQNLVIDGYNVANNPLRLRKSEELGIDNVRVHQALVTCIEMTDTSLFHSHRLQIARAPIGIKTLGSCGTLGLVDMNAYLLDSVVSVQGAGVANMVVSGTSFIELCKVGVEFNRPAQAISIGTIHFKDCYVTSTLTLFTLFKGVASSGINATSLSATGLNAYIPNVTTTPFLDFSGMSNNGSTLRAKLMDSSFTATALGAGKLVSVNAAQNWYQLFVDLIRVIGLTTAQYATTFVTGGVALTPLQISGSGTPEAVMTAPTGSIYFNYGGYGPTAIYQKHSGTGNTGWVPIGSTLAGPGGGLFRISVADDGALTTTSL